MTDGRVGRVSTTVATQTDADARLGRLSTTVASQPDPDARLGRLSVTIAVAIPLGGKGHGGWGIIPIG